MQALETVHPRNLKDLYIHLQSLTRARLWLQILIGMVLGILTGLLLGPDMDWVKPKTGEIIGEWLALPGYFFLALIQLIVVPLVLSSVVRGIAASQDVDQLRKTGSRLLVYFVVTTALAVAIGITVGLVMKPGSYIDASKLEAGQAAQSEAIDLSDVTEGGEEGFSLKTLPRDIVALIPENPSNVLANADMLKVVILALILGVALVSLAASQAKPLLELLGSIEAVCMTIVQKLMLIAPAAVFGLIAQVTIKTGVGVLLGMGVYVGVVLLGFAVLLLFYMLILVVLGRYNPLKFLGAVREAQLMAFSVNSSAAVMPLSIKTAEEKLDVRPSTAQFVIPIGATINMNGSALYQGLATIFIAQVFGITLPISALLALIVTAVGASIGTPATPGVGIIVLSTVLTSAGLPLEGITLIIGLDRILEMFRTMLNVTGDLIACVVMDRSIQLKQSKAEEQAEAARIEETRAATGEDVVMAPPAARPA